MLCDRMSLQTAHSHSVPSHRERERETRYIIYCPRKWLEIGVAHSLQVETGPPDRVLVSQTHSLQSSPPEKRRWLSWAKHTTHASKSCARQLWITLIEAPPPPSPQLTMLMAPRESLAATKHC